MIEMFRQYFPYLLVLYFVIRGFKQPLFFLGLPFLMFMDESIFFNKVKLFTMPGSLEYGLMFYWIILVRIGSIILAKTREKTEFIYEGSVNGMDFCIMGLMAISFFGLGTTLVHYSDLTGVIKEFVVLISMFVSYFIIKNWTANNDPEVLIQFLFSIVLINSLAAVFYIVHQGLHFGIYPSEEYSIDIVANVEITRTFYFMPQFLPFSIAFLLIFRKRQPFLYITLIVISILAVFISYTRSFLFNGVMIFIFYFVFIGMKEGRIGLVIKNILVYFVISLFGFLIISIILPANTQYFMNRFSELGQTSATSGPNNIEYRFQMTSLIVESMDENKKILGMGSVSANQESWVRPMKATTADMVWTGVIFRWGYAGLMLFILLYILSGAGALNFFMKKEGVLADLALLFLIYIISQVIESFFSWTFMSGHGFATGLWYFAMLSAVIGFSKNKVNLQLETNQKDEGLTDRTKYSRY